MKRILVYGAGAIGRGYLPWVFSPDSYEYSYVEVNPRFVKLLRQRKKFTSYKTKKDSYESLQVSVKQCYFPGEEEIALKNTDAVATAVGPRNISLIAESLKGTNAPIICAENDPSTVDFIRSVTGNKRAVFSIPDVITSNTAPKSLLAKDPLAITTEEGICYIDNTVSHLKSSARYVSKQELEKQWKAKLYLHNTPHCIAAYLGADLKVQYVHEAMEHKGVYKVVEGAMNEMKGVLLKKFKLPKTFVEWYAKKELRRFSNTLLFDPVSRVAREPFRKLAPQERLIGAAQLCLSSGILPSNIMVGIMSAFYYHNPTDADAHIAHLVGALNPGDFLHIAMRLQPGSALYELLLANWNSNFALFKKLSA